MAKFLKIKYPLIAGLLVTVIYDYSIHMYTDTPKGHWYAKALIKIHLIINFSFKTSILFIKTLELRKKLL